MRQLLKKKIGLSVMLCVIALSGCQCDKPNEPEPVITEIDYPVYFKKNEDGYGNSTFLHRYRPNSNELDSILMPDTFNFFVISSDGKQIYIPANDETRIYDIETQEIIAVLPYFGRVSFSPDSQLVAITDGKDLYIIDAHDYSLIFHDTTNIVRSFFTRDNKKLFCFNSVTPNLIVLDRENNFFKTEKQIDVLSGWPIPSFDGEKIFFLRNLHAYASVFEVYDFTVDSVIFSDIHYPGYGLMTISPDGKYVFYTNPGSLHPGTTPPPYYNVYNVEKNELLEISTLDFPGTENDSSKSIVVQEVAVTADGRWITAIGYDYGSYITAAEIESMTIVKSRKITNWGSSWWNLTSSAFPPL